MPYPRIEPASVEEMYCDTHPGHFSICQYLRDIHSAVEDEEVRLKIRYCWAWAKRMHKEIKKLHTQKADRYCRELEEKGNDNRAQGTESVSPESPVARHQLE